MRSFKLEIAARRPIDQSLVKIRCVVIRVPVGDIHSCVECVVGL